MCDHQLILQLFENPAMTVGQVEHPIDPKFENKRPF
jgi:hypothetical protein